MHIPTNSPDGFGSSHSVQLPGVGAFAAAIPAMLGFHPHRSMVLVAVKDAGTVMGPTMRHDLVLAGKNIERRAGGTRATPEMLDVIEFLAGYCASEGFPDIIALFVDDRFEGPHSAQYLLDVDSLVDELESTLGSLGIRLTSAFGAHRIARGASWWSLLGPQRTGRIDDPESSPLAVARIVDGLSILRSRAELAESIRPDPIADRLEVSAAVKKVRRDNEDGHTAQLESVLEYVAAFAYTDTLDAYDVGRIGVAIGVVPVRDALLALTLGDHADDVERLWTVMTRRLPDCERAIAATLLAFSAYSRGDGPMARTAIDVALECDETYSLALLLDRSLSSGASPDLIREVAESGFGCARACGVILPGDYPGDR